MTAVSGGATVLHVIAGLLIVSIHSPADIALSGTVSYISFCMVFAIMM